MQCDIFIGNQIKSAYITICDFVSCAAIFNIDCQAQTDAA